jgi:hypothetical protein
LTSPPDEPDDIVNDIIAKSPTLGLDIPDGTNFEHWLAVGKHLALADNALAWRIGDWWAFGEHRYGDRVAVVCVNGWDGPGFGACRNYATVARAFETSRRRDVLSFCHHQEVASLPPDDADRLLDWAEEPLCNDGKPRSTRELRDQVRQRNAARWRAYNRPRTTPADVADAISRVRKEVESLQEIERLRRLASRSPPDAKLDDSPNILPVPAELAALQVEPAPDVDRLAIARAALGALDHDQRIELFLECPGEVRVAHARLTRSEASAH